MSGIRYNVVLLNNGGAASKKANFVKAIVYSLNISTKEAENLVGSAPCVLAEDVPEDIAYALKEGIEASGGQVKLIEIEQNNNNNESIDSVNNADHLSFQKLNYRNGSKDSTSEFNTLESKQDMASKVGVSIDRSQRVSSSIPRSKQSNAPTFTAPGQQSSAPTFTAPGQQSSAPTFTASGQQSSAPNFSIHNHRHPNGECCSFHPNNSAVMRCDNCGRPICDACREVGELTDGSHVCFDCASAIVLNDVDIAKAKRSKIVLKIVLGIIGAIIFGIISSTSGFKAFFQSSQDDYPILLWQILFTLFGASLSIYFPALKTILAWIWKFIRWKPEILRRNVIIDYIFSGIKFTLVIFAITGFFLVFSVFMTFSPVVALGIAVVDIVRYTRANNLVKRNREILQHLSDRMEYIRIQSEENADIEALANDDRMQNNQFAQAVRRQGYASANKTFSDEAQEMTENDKKIKKFVLNEYGEVVRAA